MMAETMALARELDQTLVLLTTFPAFITALLARGERAQAEAALPEYDALLARLPHPMHRLRRLLITSLLATLTGDTLEAERAREEASALAREARTGPSRLLWLTHRLSIAQLLGRPEELGYERALLLMEFDHMPSAVPYVAWLLIGDGRREEARERLRRLNLEPLGIPAASLTDLMGAAEAAVLLGDAELGERIYPALSRASDRPLWNMAPGSLLGPTARALGDLARCIGRREEALRHYDAAIAFVQKLGSPPLLEVCRKARAALLADAAPAARATHGTATDATLAEKTPPPAATPLQPPAREAPAASQTPAASATPAARPPTRLTLRRDGELWLLQGGSGAPLHLKPSKGLDYLEKLLASPGRSVHVLELAGIEHFTGDAGALLDPRAKQEYRRRLDDLGEALAEAEAFGDAQRAREVQAEIDALAEQLAQAVGLGGRDRRAASDVERARVNVQRRLKDAIARIGAADPALGRYLAVTVQTGTYCVFRPL